MRMKMWKASALSALVGTCMASSAMGQGLTCADAGLHPITLGVPATGVFSTNEPLESSPQPTGCTQSSSGRSQWWSFTPAMSGRYKIQMCDSAHLDTHLGIGLLSDACTGALTYIGCNDDACGLGSQVVVNLDAGVPYRVRTAAWGSSITNGGAYSVLIELDTLPAAPANDDCSMATVAMLGSQSGNNAGATGSDASSCGGTGDINDVYYTFTTTDAGLYRFSVCSGNFDSVMSLHTGCPADSSNQIASSCVTSVNPAVLGCTNRGSSFGANLGAAQQVWVRIAGAADQSTTGTTTQPAPYLGWGAFDLNISFIAAPANDDCANSEVIASFPFSASVDNTAANNSGSLGGCDRAKDVWYTFTAPDNGAVVLNETGSQDAAWGAYNADPCGGGATNILCSTTDTGLSFLATMGQQYWIRVSANSTTSSTSSPLTFDISFVTAPANDDCATAEEVTSFPYSNTVANISANNSGLIGTCERFGDVWYELVSPGNGAITLNETGTQDAAWGVYDADPCAGSVNSIVCSTTDTGVSVFPVFMGQSYWVRVGTAASSTSRTTPLALNFEFTPSPANDFCDDAVVLDVLSGGSETIDARAAQNDDDISCNGSAVEAVAGVWYTFTTGMDAGVVAFAESSSASVATQLYTGMCGSLVEDGTCSTAQSRNFAVQPNTTYTLLVAMSSTTRPAVAYSFTYQFVTAPANDLCANAQVIDLSSAGSVQVSALAATDDLDVTCNSGSPSSLGVWYTFTPSASGTLALNQSGGGDLFHAIFDGVDCNSLNQIACSDPPTSSTPLTGGTQYWLLVGDWSSSSPPTADYVVQYSFDPIDGACCDGANCSIMTEADCMTGGGMYLGDNSSCEASSGENATSVNIPDFLTTYAPITSDIVVSGVGGMVSTLAVNVDVVHTWLGDLRVELIGPDATTTYLFGDIATTTCPADGAIADGDDMDGVYTFADTATQSLRSFVLANPSPIAAGSYRAAGCDGVPVDLNTIFAATPADGTWTLRVGDRDEAITGTLRAWSIVINGGTPVCMGSTPCPGDFNGDDAVDLADLIAFNTDWQPNIGTTQPAGTNGDYNGDTMVDLADLIAFNTDWQPNIGVPCP